MVLNKLASQFYKSHQENIVNRPNYLALDADHQRLMGNNLRLKYLMKYEKRVVERNLQKKIARKLAAKDLNREADAVANRGGPGADFRGGQVRGQKDA